ncbi:hypothetical protein [Vreelandella rituensis]|uniref:hypothetical protein n=1 Tax=Vreelandella rituensis TaxID=2282306 RepID=UPI0039EFA258
MVEKAGAWYSCQGTRIGQGKANAAQYLEEHPELMAEIEAGIRAQLLPDSNQAPPAEEALAPADTTASSAQDDGMADALLDEEVPLE